MTQKLIQATQDRNAGEKGISVGVVRCCKLMKLMFRLLQSSSQ